MLGSLGGHTPQVALLLAAAILSGCAPSPTVPDTVLVPVAVSCAKDAPDAPLTMDEAAIRAMDDYAATLHIWTERLLLKSYAARAEAIIAACR